MSGQLGVVAAGWIAPHGVVPDMPATELARVPATHAAMKLAAGNLVAVQPDSVVLVAPHGFRAADSNTVSLCRNNAIELSTWYPWRTDEMRVPGDADLGRLILESAAAADVSAVGLVYGATSEPVYPMDWSITSPMRYLQEAGYSGSLTPVTFSSLPLTSEWEFGRAIGGAIRASGKRVAVIASSDLSHVHSADGPYGYDPIAPLYDSTIERAVKENDLFALTNLNLDWVKKAAQDGLRSILIMGGAIEAAEFSPRVLAYEVFGYFGMLTAWLGP